MDLFIKLLPELLEGLKLTVSIFCYCLLASIPLGILVAIIKTLNIKVLNVIIDVYIWVMRGTPLLLQMVFFYFGLPQVGIVLEREVVQYLAIILNYTAYFAEIYRGGIKAIDNGQMEAGKVLGFTPFYTFRSVIMPQALKNTLPSVGNEVINLIKDTSLVYVLGSTELLKVGKAAANTYATPMPFFYVAVFYLLFTAIVTFVLKQLEKKLDYYR